MMPIFHRRYLSENTTNFDNQPGGLHHASRGTRSRLFKINWIVANIERSVQAYFIVFVIVEAVGIYLTQNNAYCV